MTKLQIDILCIVIQLIVIGINIPMWNWRRRKEHEAELHVKFMRETYGMYVNCISQINDCERSLKSLKEKFRVSDFLAVAGWVAATLGITATLVKYLPL